MFGHKEKPLRQQLTEALAECQRQIEILRSPPAAAYAVPSDNSAEIALMESEYRRLAQALADLGPDNA